MSNIDPGKFKPYPQSQVVKDGTIYWMAHDDHSNRYLIIQGDDSDFESIIRTSSGESYCPLTPANAAAIRQQMPWLKPVPLGLKTSMGLGDRLGLATPGHIAAIEQTRVLGIFAQQSVRENARTGRTPQQVLDDAMWGIFQEGHYRPWGADADHMKTLADIEPFVKAGYSFFTVDPGDHVQAITPVALAGLNELFASLPWQALEISPVDLEKAYLARPFNLEELKLEFTPMLLKQAAVKYGKAIAHIVTMYRRLVELLQGKPFDFEVSVDETETPTSAHEHFFIANELQRLGVRWVSLAPRFVGRFEKGVDYIGDLEEFEREFIAHAAIMRHFGTYKVSIHSGSDKFSVYPVVARHTNGILHVKTAGTSYLEALRLIATVEPAFFREILDFSRSQYETDKASYHVSAELVKVPESSSISVWQLPDLLNQFDAREVLHVTYGSVLANYENQLKSVLKNNADAYARGLKKHIQKHLDTFTH